MHTISRLFLACMIAILATGCASSEVIKQRRALRMNKAVTMNGTETIEQSIARLEQIELEQIELDPPEGESEKDRAVRRIALEELYKQRNLRKELQKQKVETPIEHKARLQYEKQTGSNVKHDRKSVKALQTVNVQRCKEEPLWVNPGFGNDWGMRISASNNTVMVMITNKGKLPIDIVSSYHGDLIRRLCEDGTVRFPFASRYMGADQLSFTLKAFMYTPLGVVTEEKKIQIQANNQAGAYHNPQLVDGVSWEPFQNQR